MLAAAAVLAACAPDGRTRNHSQQAPVPGFARAAAPDTGGWFDGWFEERATPAERAAAFTGLSDSDCRPLDGGLRPVFACRTADGHRFILQ